MKTIKSLWASLAIQPFPYLHELAPVDQDRFVLLDAYLRDCVEEWSANGGQLTARSIVLLDDCANTITKRFSLLDGEGQFYFGQFRKLARRILRGINVDQAYCRAEKETDAELDWEYTFDDFLSDLASSAEAPARG